MAREYPPAHVIHEITCTDAPPGLFAFRAAALRTYPNSRPHSCFSSATVAHNREVVAEPVTFEEHPYRASTIRPDDATRPLCITCRGTHGGDQVHLADWLALR